MNIKIEDRAVFEEMLKNDEIKKTWTQIEDYGIDAVISVAFEEELDLQEVQFNTIFDKDAVAAHINDGIVYKGIYVNEAYIHNNNDVILMCDHESKILIIENKNIKVSDCSKCNK